ncbi:hypothetical protein E2562_005851 [Oryza meyeriana var. granulata]|uniref:Uncharacterized protein n=1 Tax=Oryza meyeriana var. granulata TaxID=110450 RepID=A0A6G1CDL1_9ORYZ|nr:hypothetical protein E2562_005851 [Oryza meyeriana var. granulata]
MAAAHVAASSTLRSHRHLHLHRSAWRLRRRRREHWVRAVVAEAEEGAEVDAAAARVVASSTSRSHRHLHWSVWRSRRRLRTSHRLEAVEDRRGASETRDGEVEAVVVNQP